MVDFNRVRQVFEGSDRLSRTVQKISKSFDGLSQSIEETGTESTELSLNFRELDRMMNEVGEQATPTTSNRFRLLKESIENTVTQDDIVSIRALDQELERLGEQAGFTDQTIENLRRTGRDLAKQFFGTSISAEQLSSDIQELGNEGTLTAQQVSLLRQAIDRTADAGDILSVEQLKDEVEELGLGAALTAAEMNEMNRELDKTLVSALGASGGMSQATFSALGLREAVDEAEDEVEELRNEFGFASLAATNFGLTSAATALTVEAFADQFDDAVDKFEEFREAIDNVLPENPITTLNLGPVNISLQQMGTTIVSLTTFIGPLVTTIGGLTTALGTLTVAVGSFLAVGLLGFLEELERRFASITNRMEAMEAVAKGLFAALQEALAPLFGAQIGGMGPIQFFISTLRGSLRIVRDFAEIMAEIVEMREVRQFLSEVSEALFTGDAGPSMMQALKTAVEDLVPILTQMVVFLINNLPELIMFMTEISRDVAPALALIFNKLIPLFAQLIRVGTRLFQVMSILISVGADLISIFTTMFNFVDQLFFFLDLGDAVEVLIAVVFGLIVAFVVLFSIISTIVALVGTAILVYQAWGAITAFLAASNFTLSGALLSAAGSLVTLTAAALPYIGIALLIIIVTAGIIELVSWFMRTDDPFESLAEGAEGFLNLLNSIADRLDFRGALQFPNIDIPTLRAPTANRAGRAGGGSGGFVGSAISNLNVIIQGNVEDENRFTRKVARAVDRKMSRREKAQGGRSSGRATTA